MNFSPPNTNTFGLKFWTEYKYEYIRFENFNRIGVRISLGFWKAQNNSVSKYIWSKLFEYIRIPNYLLTSELPQTTGWRSARLFLVGITLSSDKCALSSQKSQWVSSCDSLPIQQDPAQRPCNISRLESWTKTTPNFTQSSTICCWFPHSPPTK